MRITAYICSLFAALFFVSELTAQVKVVEGIEAGQLFEHAVKVRFDENSNSIQYVEFEENHRPDREAIFSILREQLNLSTDFQFEEKSHIEDQIGFLHEKYSQFYKGVEVKYAILSLHSKQGKVHAINGNFIIAIPEETEIALSANQAFGICLDKIDASSYYGENNPFYDVSPEKNNGSVVYLPKFTKDGERSIIKCYQFNIYAKTPLSRTLFFVNVNTGEIEFSENLIHTGNSNGVAVTAYSDTQNIITDSLSTFFRLVDTTRGNGVETYNCHQSRSYSSAVDFTDADNFWNNFNANLDQYATDAHWGTEQTYDYLLNIHNRNSIDNLGFALKSYIHYDVNYVNAFWDGQRMTYGDGNFSTTPLTALDIVGHEIAHGLTDRTSDLVYAKESGALNESFSDIFGTAVEFYARPNRANWLIGEDIGGAFRSMSNPEQYGDPDTYNGQYWVDQNCTPSSSNDHCGVHRNSGVQNKWFYLLVLGGSGVNDLADTFQVNPIGLAKAEKIAFRNLTVYLSPNSNFEDARFYAIISAIDLYGACSPEVEATTNAWHAVGVGNKYANGVSASFVAEMDTAYCYFPVTVNFQSTGSNVIGFKWDFGNGDTSFLRNPIVTYNSQGNYDVTLNADGGSCGSDTILKPNYLKIDTNISCASFLTSGNNPVATSCNGRLYDSGGLDKDYQIDEEGIFTIRVPTADYIDLSFITTQIEAGSGFNCNKDYLEIYDGDSINDPSLGRFCKNFLPANNLISSSSNAITIRFNSDKLLTAPGFLISWECKQATQLPLVDFEVESDSTCSGLVKFFDRTTNGTQQLIWDFGDGNFNTEKNPIHEYKGNGNYNIKLIAQNSIGLDSLTKTAFVNVSRPAAPTVNNDTVCVGATAGLKVNTTEDVEWYRDTTASSIFSGDSITVFN